MIGALITLIVYIIVLAVLWWLVNYVLENFTLPDPLSRMIRVAVTVIFVLIGVFMLLGIFGIGGFEVPRLRIGAY